MIEWDGSKDIRECTPYSAEEYPLGRLLQGEKY